LPSAAAFSPYTRGDGDSLNAEKYSRVRVASTAFSKVSRWRSNRAAASVMGRVLTCDR
jgi:hypothetical protein